MKKYSEIIGIYFLYSNKQWAPPPPKKLNTQTQTNKNKYTKKKKIPTS